MGAQLAREIPVSVPCHCRLLFEAADAFQDVLNHTPMKSPTRAVMSNVDLTIHDEPVRMRKLLAQQLYSPVRWVETVQAMKAVGIQQILECGPGRVLAGLTKRIDNTIKADSINTPDSLEKLLMLEGISE